MFEKLRNINKPKVWAVVANVIVIALIGLWILTIQKGLSESITKIKINISGVEGVKDLILDKEVYEMIVKSNPADIRKIPLSKIKVNAIEKLIQQDSRIHKADVYIDAQKNLVVDVEQRQPIMRVKDKNGLDYYIDQDGNFVSKSQYRAVRVPIVTGYLERYDETWRNRPDSKINKAYTIAQAIQEDPFLVALIEQINFEKSDRIVLIPKIGNEKIVLQYMDDLDHKLANLKTFYQEMAKTKKWDYYDEIDISYKNQVIGRNSVKP